MLYVSILIENGRLMGWGLWWMLLDVSGRRRWGVDGDEESLGFCRMCGSQLSDPSTSVWKEYTGLIFMRDDEIDDDNEQPHHPHHSHLSPYSSIQII